MNKVIVLIFTLLFSAPAFGINSYLKLRLKNFRDPFKKNILKSHKAAKKKKQRSYYSNKSSIDSISLETLKIVGVYLGKERRAIATDGKSEDPFIIKEGMKLGADRIEVKAILPGGIVLVEKIINVYDEVEYLETIIPVSE